MHGCTCERCIQQNDLRDESGLFTLSTIVPSVCRHCGKKRCPSALDHRFTCAYGGERGHAGSLYTLTARGTGPHGSGRKAPLLTVLGGLVAVGWYMLGG
jgi:hypothetical protein